MAKLPSKSLEGRRIKLLKCNDAYTKIPVGTLGTVSVVDDVGTVHVNWDDGSMLGLCWDDGDRWEVLPQKQGEFTSEMKQRMKEAGIDPDEWLKRARANVPTLAELRSKIRG